MKTLVKLLILFMLLISCQQSRVLEDENEDASIEAIEDKKISDDAIYDTVVKSQLKEEELVIKRQDLVRSLRIIDMQQKQLDSLIKDKK